MGVGGHLAKREKIARKIRQRFPKADVKFSEAITLRGILPQANRLGDQEKEEWHLYACNLCVVLDISKGPGEDEFTVTEVLNLLEYKIPNEIWSEIDKFAMYDQDPERS